MSRSGEAEEFGVAQPAPGGPSAEALVTGTRDLLDRLRGLLELDERYPQAHLSFSGIPELVIRVSALLTRAMAGDAAAYQDLARSMAHLDRLRPAIEHLHAAGSISPDVLRACRALMDEYGWLAEGWASAAAREHDEPVSR